MPWGLLLSGFLIQQSRNKDSNSFTLMSKLQFSHLIMVVPPGSHRYPISTSLGWPVLLDFINPLLSYGLRSNSSRDRTCKKVGLAIPMKCWRPFSDLLTYQRANGNPVHSAALHHSVRVHRVSRLPGEIQSAGPMHN